MTDISGMKKAELQALPQMKDRMTFLYLERCVISRRDSALSVKNQEGVVYVPVATISVLLLGPGTDISHRAMELIGDTGVSVVWVGEHGVRYYASGCPLTHRTGLLQRQAAMVSNQRLHLKVVRKMYALRFPDEDISTLTLAQLRGREGSRIRSVYRDASRQWNIPWSGRDYDHDNFANGDKVNQALSMGHACLYGLAHAVIVAIGCSPGLGFVHVGHDCSFVYDVADLYKAKLTIPIAFEMAATSGEVDNFESAVRRRVRDEMVAKHFLPRMVHDIHWLFQDEEISSEEDESSAVYLWNGSRGVVENARQYGNQESN